MAGLERAALGESDGAVAAHLAACAACRDCLDRLRADVVALPPLRVEAVRPRARWWRFGIAGLGAALAAAVLAIVLIPPRDRGGPDLVAAERVAHVKGVGDVVVGVVRDRAGAIAEDATTFRAGDRWKVVVTCAAPADACWTWSSSKPPAPPERAARSVAKVRLTMPALLIRSTPPTSRAATASSSPARSS